MKLLDAQERINAVRLAGSVMEAVAAEEEIVRSVKKTIDTDTEQRIEVEGITDVYFDININETSGMIYNYLTSETRMVVIDGEGDFEQDFVTFALEATEDFIDAHVRFLEQCRRERAERMRKKK